MGLGFFLNIKKKHSCVCIKTEKKVKYNVLRLNYINKIFISNLIINCLVVFS